MEVAQCAVLSSPVLSWNRWHMRQSFPCVRLLHCLSLSSSWTSSLPALHFHFHYDHHRTDITWWPCSRMFLSPSLFSFTIHGYLRLCPSLAVVGLIEINCHLGRQFNSITVASSWVCACHTNRSSRHLLLNRAAHLRLQITLMHELQFFYLLFSMLIVVLTAKKDRKERKKTDYYCWRTTNRTFHRATIDHFNGDSVISPVFFSTVKLGWTCT